MTTSHACCVSPEGAESRITGGSKFDLSRVVPPLSPPPHAAAIRLTRVRRYPSPCSIAPESSLLTKAQSAFDTDRDHSEAFHQQAMGTMGQRVAGAWVILHHTALFNEESRCRFSFLICLVRLISSQPASGDIVNDKRYQPHGSSPEAGLEPHMWVLKNQKLPVRLRRLQISNHRWRLFHKYACWQLEDRYGSRRSGSVTWCRLLVDD